MSDHKAEDLKQNLMAALGYVDPTCWHVEGLRKDLDEFEKAVRRTERDRVLTEVEAACRADQWPCQESDGAWSVADMVKEWRDDE